MKKTSCIVVLFLSFMSLHAQMSYYYHGKKVSLTVDRNYVNVIVDEDFMNSTMASQTFQKFNMESGERNSAQGLVKMKFKSALDMTGYSETVKSLKQNKQIKCVLPFFERGENVLPIGTSDIFYIQLKDAKDTELLAKVAKAQGVQIVKQIPHR